MKIGILGGTFNPIHYGHLLHAENIRTRKKLDKIIFVPSKNPPHKMDMKIPSFNIRKTMVEIAIKSNPFFLMSEIESHRLGPSYTVDTLAELKSMQAEDEFYLILGADSILSIETWKDYEDILTSIKVLVIDRYKDRIQDLDKNILKYKKNYGDNIEKVQAPLIDISSTDIRDRIKKGLSIKYYLPEDVENYIYENQLYLKDEN